MNSESFIPITTIPDNDYTSIYALHPLNSTKWLIGSNTGVTLFLPEQMQIKSIPALEFLNNYPIRSILSDNRKIIWIGTLGLGLIRWDRQKNTCHIYQNNPENQQTISHNDIHSLYQDRSGVIWVGTYGGGINKFDGNEKKFALYRRIANQPNSLNNNIIWSIAEDKKGILWIGTHGGGLNRFDRKNNQFTHFLANSHQTGSLSNNYVRLVFFDQTGTLWVGTHGGGLNQYLEGSQKFVHYTHQPQNPDSINHNEIRSIYEDRQGTLWIGTYGGGLNRFDRRTKKFQCFIHQENDPQSISNNIIRALCEDRMGHFWIGTYGGGLNLMDRKAQTFRHFQNNAENPHSLNNNYIFSIHEDQSGILWIGTWGGGLNKFDPQKKQFSHFTTENGFPYNAIYGILEDEQHNLWLSSNNGLCRFNPRTCQFRSYTASDNLQSNEFNGGSFFRSSSGEMFFGGINGFNSFFPAEIKDNCHIPPLVITSFKVLNKNAQIPQHISLTEKLSLTYKDYFFSFQFAALDYVAPDKNNYAYKMEGLNRDWIYTKNRYVTYTTLPAGNYTFMVKGSNNDGVWNKKGTQIQLTIVPPFWKTWWFIFLLGLTVISTGWLLYSRRVKNIRFRTRLETELKTAHNAQLSIMPQTDPLIDGFDICGLCLPASEVGGDFFDYHWLEKGGNYFGFSMGDVSGKAMNAAMTAVMTNGLIFSKALETNSLHEIVSQLNESLFYKTDKRIFIALFIALIHRQTKVMSFANSGLPKPLIYSNQQWKIMDSNAVPFPLGIRQDIHVQVEKVQLQSGDCIIFFTDGVIESLNIHDEFYDYNRLIKFLETLPVHTLTSSEIKEKILADIRDFSAGTHQHDDLTMIVLKVLS
jgi:serine phosphatase RsbU (regulator of sigma subunit)/streptogramin lyase